MEEAFNGIIRFNRWLLIVDIILIIWYLYGWYDQFRKTGSYIDYWRFNMLLVFFLPVLLMYPFSSSSLNVLTVLGLNNLYNIQDYIDEAYIVTITGFLGVYIGKYIYDYFHPVLQFEIIIIPFSSTLGKFFSTIVRNSSVSRFFSFFYILILIGFVLFIVTAGLLGNPREFFMINTQYAPIYTFILNTFEIVFVIISTRALQYNKGSDKIFFFTLILFGFFLGVRAPLFLRGLSFGVLYILYRKQGYVPFVKIAVIVLSTLFLIMLFAFIRNTDRSNGIDLNIALQSFVPEILYGNTFSDLRDFSWVLSYWNRDLYWGLSYFAAILSFIPSSIYPIRQTYGIGKITVLTAGLDPITHPGLRMGIFGEMYINFGIIAVVLFGILWGYVTRRVDVLTRKYATEGNVIKASSVIVYSSFISYLTGSAGFWGFYITIFLLSTLYLATRVRIS